MQEDDAQAAYFRLFYPYEKLLNGVFTLATSGAPLRQRLYSALSGMMAVQPENFPDDELLQAFTRLKKSITAEGSVEDTLRQTRRATHERIATQFFELYLGVKREIDRLEASMNRSDE
jgi:hypothetical protein